MTAIDRSPFPAGFLWGAATAAYQIEGATEADGRGPSIWDVYCRQPGAIQDGSSGEPAAGHYARWREDVALVRELGLRAYRFSIGWSRVLPDGSRLNIDGLDFYDRLVDELLAHDITPLVTLNHWDLPATLQERGGWPERDTMSRYVEYADVVTRRLGDRVKGWVTHNEPWVIGFLGYYYGQHAPGLRGQGQAALQAIHHLLVSHGMAVPVTRANSPGAEVGIVNIHFPNRPATSTEADVPAAERAELLDLRWFLDPLFGRGYPAEALDWYGAHAPHIEPGDMQLIASPIDFLGVNYYYRRILAGDPAESLFGYRELPHPSSAPTGMFWSEIDPRALGDHLLWLSAEYPGPKLYITENGLPLPNEPADERGYVDDQARIAYLAGHIAEVGRAIRGGAPVAGYFAWCLFDTFEWNYGYSPRFGLVRIERPSLVRVPKASAHWYRTLIEGYVSTSQAADTPASIFNHYAQMPF